MQDVLGALVMELGPPECAQSHLHVLGQVGHVLLNMLRNSPLNGRVTPAQVGIIWRLLQVHLLQLVIMTVVHIPLQKHA